MLASLAAPTPAHVAPRPRASTAAGRPGRRAPEALAAALAFGLLCLWMRASPARLAAVLGAAGFDAAFGLGR